MPAAMAKPVTRPRRSSGTVVPHTAKWHQRLAAFIVYAGLRSLTASLRYVWEDTSDLHNGGKNEPAIYCIWHNRLTLSMRIYFAYVRERKQSTGLAALVSASKDGALLARILEDFGVQPVRGSSSRRGPQALLELTTWADLGYDLAITPDGPRGPCYTVQEGVMSLAQLTSLPVVPVSCEMRPKIRLRSWDRFQIPLPFGKCVIRLGEPIRVPRDATDQERESLRKQLEQRLRALGAD